MIKKYLLLVALILLIPPSVSASPYMKNYELSLTPQDSVFIYGIIEMYAGGSDDWVLAIQYQADNLENYPLLCKRARLIWPHFKKIADEKGWVWGSVQAAKKTKIPTNGLYNKVETRTSSIAFNKIDGRWKLVSDKCVSAKPQRVVNITSKANSAGKKAFKEKNYRKAFEIFKVDAENGSVPDQFMLGLMYGKGYGVKKDYNQAYKWFKLSADKGYVKSQFSLGHMYRAGRGVSKNPELAMKWLLKAAEAGYADAQANVGAYYRKGWGVKKDSKKAEYWLRKAADQGQPKAAAFLGMLYEDGDELKKDLDEAKKYYRIAASKGNKEAIKRLNELR